ncbi:GAF domain-containing protein [Marinobacter sp. LV10R520-4]|uniref:GAF domain-containing protein n=1 Tax=Marinobacter sp. LV10R520-4 TaxID=1761796 RepID=UPI001E4576DE|nr:GAF domain-containing protein [Marinobacter sp. LV10R520-4]
MTANRKCATVPVHGAPDISTNQPLNMTYSAYRSRPLMHLAYLGNMGVAAALTISLIQNGRLWGMLTWDHIVDKVGNYRKNSMTFENITNTNPDDLAVDRFAIEFESSSRYFQ